MKVTENTTGIDYWDGITDAERLSLFTSNDEGIPTNYEENELRFIPFFKLPNSVKEEIYQTLGLWLRKREREAQSAITKWSTTDMAIALQPDRKV